MRGLAMVEAGRVPLRAVLERAARALRGSLRSVLTAPARLGGIRPAVVRVVVRVLLVCLFVPAVAGAQEGGEPSPAEKYFTNVELVDHHGRTVRLYRDLLQGKVVVIDTIFTECVGICPVMSKTFQRIQEHVGERLGRDVHLLSISVDPETDTPERLAEMAARFDARPGWYFLTGDKENVRLALSKLGSWVEDREAHNAVVLIGNEPTGLWKKAFGLAPAAKILPVVDSVLNDAGPEAEPAGGRR